MTASRADVARLLGRAAFGARAADLDRWAGQPYAAVVDSLFPPGNVAPPSPDDAERVELENVSGVSFEYLRGNIGWWTDRMRTNAYPLVERMAFFWHDHFATAWSNAGPYPRDLIRQNQILRTHALGDFRQLCYEVTVEVSMLVWLNGQRNRRGAVNENFARELFELFTLGTNPQVYTQADIEVAAKALTGWFIDTTVGRTGKFAEGRHDLTVKSLFGAPMCNGVSGATGEFAHETEYQRVIDAALAKTDVASRHLATCLVRNFGYEPDLAAVAARTEPLVEKVAAAFRPAAAGGRYDIAAAVRTMLLADEWRDYVPAESCVRQPVEVLVHAAKILGVDLYQWRQPGPSLANPNPSRIHEPDFMDSCGRAGQVPFVPPNVGGWSLGEPWVAVTLNMARYEMFHHLFGDWAVQNASTRVAVPASSDIDGWIRLMALPEVGANTRAALEAYRADPGTTNEVLRQKAMFILVGTSPEWQVL